tara:strand:+ start:105 stop:503 length:399 start_codon:yes stop_codon:yes gene_type:complete
MTSPGKKARGRKIKNEGLTNPQDKIEVYRVMSIYSKRAGFTKPTCTCCGFNDWKFLVFGHTTKKRPKSHVGKKGVSLARQLADERYPKTVTVLCHNCNTSQEIWGDKCPHKLSEKAVGVLKENKLPAGRLID